MAFKSPAERTSRHAFRTRRLDQRQLHVQLKLLQSITSKTILPIEFDILVGSGRSHPSTLAEQGQLEGTNPAKGLSCMPRKAISFVSYFSGVGFRPHTSYYRIHADETDVMVLQSKVEQLEGM